MYRLHTTEIIGAFSGVLSGIFGMVTGKILISNEAYAVVMAFLTGAAGAAGALLVRYMTPVIKKAIHRLIKIARDE